jgi:four helix bundle protein
MRRAAVSVPSNIAEGQGRGNCNEFVRFLRIGRGSLQEVQTQVLIARRLNYLSEDRSAAVLELADELGRIINGLISSLTTDN